MIRAAHYLRFPLISRFFGLSDSGGGACRVARRASFTESERSRGRRRSALSIAQPLVNQYLTVLIPHVFGFGGFLLDAPQYISS